MLEQLASFLNVGSPSLHAPFAEGVPETIQFFQSAVQWAAIVLTALAGVAEARRRDLDYFGALVIAFVVSVGGGTLRDVLLSRYPLFWVTSPVYLVTVLIVATIGTFIIAQGEKQVPAIEPLVNEM